MVGAGSMILFLVVMIILIPVFMIVMNRMRTRGKCVAFFLEGTLPVSPRLIKVGKDGFIEYQGRKFAVVEEGMRLIQWPLGMPTILTEMVPAALYDYDTSEQLDWRELQIEKGSSSVEIGAVLDPQWLAIFIKGMKESGGMGESRFGKMIPILTLALAALSLLMCFVLMTRISGLQNTLSVLTK